MDTAAVHSGINKRQRKGIVMDRKTFKRLVMLSTAAAAGIYGYAAGKGPFNKKRFREQHEELAKYVDNNYPDCTYSAIQANGRGWMASVRRHGRTVSVVYFTKSPDGVYVFTESKPIM